MKLRYSVALLSAALVFATLPSGLYALPAGTVTLGAGESAEVSDGAGGLLSCGLVNGVWVVGKFVSGSSSSFLPHSAAIATIKKRIKKATGLKKTKLLQSMRKLQAAKKKGDPLCVAGAAVSTPTPTPTTGAGTPTPTPVPLFDASGNVTAAGKTALGIPSSLSGNITTGRIKFESLCSCHQESTRRLYLYTVTEPAIRGGSMQFTTAQVSTQDVADITAYLNRFRT